MDGLFDSDLWLDGAKHGVATGLFFFGVAAVMQWYAKDPTIDVFNAYTVKLAAMAAVAGLGGVLLLRLIGQQGYCY